MIKIIKSNILPILLVLITILICTKNYTPGTFLTGWDTLHPEFNYREYWKRMIGGAWQEHQGLGAVASQAHASEIPRVMTLMLLDTFLPTRGVRYAYAFLMLILGPLGVFFFAKKGLFSEKKSFIIETAAFCAGLFYLLNLVTVQHFYIPLEMFLTHYGYLGFFMLTTLNLLKKWSKRNLLSFMLVSFLMAPQAHTSTMFYALLANLFGFFGIYWIFSKFNFTLLKNFIKMFGVLLLVNAFWFMPNLYFALNHGGEVQESKIHSLFNQEASLQNQAYGDIRDIALGRGFLFNWGEHVGNLQYGYLLNEWLTHQAKPHVLPLGYGLFFCSMFGVIAAVLHKRKEAVSVVGFLLVSMFFLFNLNPPTGFIYKFIEDNVPLFGDAFRFPFTKFSITLVFSYAVFFGFFVFSVLALGERVLKLGEGKNVYILCSVLSILFLVLLSMWATPIYKGGLISPSMRVKIPDRYFELFKYLDEQEGFGRVANLPIHTFWGWVYYNWDSETMLGYQGAGFLWFGIKQPLMDREFDRWNITNQEYYKDMTSAVYARDMDLFKSVLDKYKIRWIMHDESVIAPGNDQKILFKDEIRSLLGSSESIVRVMDFGGGLALYEYVPGKAFVINELMPGSEVNQSTYYAFRDIESFNEELDSSVVTSSKDSLVFTSGNISDSYLDKTEGVYLPFNIYARVLGNNLVIKFESSVHQDPLFFEYVINNVPFRNGVFNIAGKTIEFRSVGTEFTQVGFEYLPLDKFIDIKVYGEAEEHEKFDVSNMSPQLEVCSDVGRLSSYSIKRKEQGFSLSGQNADACVTAQISDVLPEIDNVDDLLIGLDVQGNFQEHPCIFNQRTTLCENHPVSLEKSYTPLVESLYTYNIRFYSRALGNIMKSEQVYDSVVLSVQRPLFKEEISIPEDFKAEVTTRPLLHALYFPKPYGFGGPAGQLVSNSRYCRSGERYKSDTPFGYSKFYETSDEEICDTFSFPLADHTTGHVLEIRARNISGVPLRICLTNEYSKRCDKYIELSAEKKMSSHFYLIPPMGNTKGYVINISNLAFAGLSSENELEYIALTPVSYSLLTNMLLGRELVDQDKVLVYNQAYEKGWVAMCGFKKCSAEHIMVDGWANGWVFEDGKIPENTPFVFFWPQLTEYLGFVMLGVFLALQLDIIRIIKVKLEKLTHSLTSILL